MRRSVAITVAAALAYAPLEAAARTRAVRTLVELRREGVVRQGWDLSCGAAALSTILTHEHGDPVGEEEIVRALLASGDPDRIRARGGFSLLDLKRYAVSRGYAAAGYGNLDSATLDTLGSAIVPTQDRAGPHFVVYRGVVRGRVLVADPSYGSRTMTRRQFEAMWSPRVAFVVQRSGSTAPPEAPDGLLASVPLVSPRVIRGALGGAIR
jgi:uncharacterized protein